MFKEKYLTCINFCQLYTSNETSIKNPDIFHNGTLKVDAKMYFKN